MSRPPWGKVAGVSLTEGGNSLSNLDCPTTNAPTPTTAVQKNSVKSEGPYNPASELPLSDTLTGATSPQRARLIYMCHYQLQVIPATAKQEPEKSRPPLGEGGPRQRWKGGTR